MRVLTLSTVHRWNDPRIFHKEACTLAKEHEVIHVAVGEESSSRIKGVEVHPLGEWESPWDRPLLWLKAIGEIIRSKADVIHFHDPELVFLLLPFSLIGNRKLICDIHEHPKGAIGGRAWIPKPIRKAVAAFFSFLLRKAPYLYDQVILAEEQYAPLFPKRNNVHLILNYALIPEPDVELPNRYNDFDPGKALKLIYIGAIVEDRGGRIMLELMESVWKTYPNTTLDLVGKIRPARLEADIKSAAESSAGHIRLYGFLDFSEVRAMLQQTHIGLIPLQPHPNHTVSVVTKFYDYMIYGLPCIASDFPLWKQFLAEHPVGVTVDATNPQAMADAVIELVENPDRLRLMSRRAYQLVREKFTWDQEGEKLLEIYRKL